MGLKHLEIDKNSIHYVGKESNELERSEFLGVFPEDTLEYVDFQKKIREIIENLILEKALEMGISRRECFYLKKKLHGLNPIKLKDKTLKKLFQIPVEEKQISSKKFLLE